jgi:hypothetical protein
VADPSRRRFLRRTAALGAAAAATPLPAATGQEPAAEDDPLRAEVDARMALVVARFGRHLDDAAREEVRRQVEGVVRQGRALRQSPLANGDEPMPIFRPFRAPDANS